MSRNYKKKFAGFLAITVILNSFLSMDISTVMGSSTSGTSNTGTIEGIIDRNVFNVELPVIPENVTQNNVNADTPVSTIYDFYIDPNGVMSENQPDKKFEPNTNLYFANKEDGASYDYSHISDALVVRNKGTINVDVELTASMKGLSGIKLTRDDNFIDDTSASIYLALMDSNKKSEPIDKYGSFLKATLKGSPGAYKVIYDSASKQYKYVLKTDAELQAEAIKFSDYTFRLAGACNSKNGWSDLPEDVAPEIEVVWCVSARPASMAPSIGKEEYAMTSGRGIAIEVDLGAGDLAAKGIKTITFVNAAGTVTTFPTANYSFKEGRLIINSACITNLVKGKVTSREYTITFDDAAETEAKFILANESIAPSIEYDSYNMESGKDVQINVDFGSGDLAADGIKSITFEKDSQTVTFPSTNYTVEGGKLIINSSCITNLIKGGLVSREYTITFNDNAQTQAKFTLLAEGTAPSVTDLSNTFTMSKDSDVVVNVDLGDGYLGANGIKMITFINSAGTEVTFPFDNYVFVKDNGTLTINKSCINNLLQAGLVSREYTIIFDDVAETKAKIVLEAEDTDPSIVGATTYSVVSGKDVEITIDLGSGESRASSIKAVTFEKDGTTATFPTSNYTFENGKLIITKECINNLIKGGLKSREYTILFDNDKTLQFTLSVDGTAPSIDIKAYTMVENTDVVVDMNMGTGSLEATGIKEITFMKSGTVATFPTSNYTYAGGRLTINKTCITTLVQAGLVSREYTIVFNDMAETKVNIVLTAQNKAPSIVGATTYPMIGGKDAEITIDLGSGESRASSIKAITFVKNGTTATFPTGNYRFENGKLIITKECIDNLIKSGLKSREYTILFDNDKTLQFTLFVDGTAPSIDTKAYTMVKNTDVIVNMNMGTGSLQATGIKEITFMKSGTVVTFPTSNYTYAGGRLTINKTCITTLVQAGLISREYTIVFNNMAETKVNIVLTAQNTAPSIVGGPTYKMTNGRGVAINLDLGSGQSRATGITRITFVKGGVIAVFPTSNYRVENETLIINKTCISNLLNAGLTSREYTITFNNGASTQARFTLVN